MGGGDTCKFYAGENSFRVCGAKPVGNTFLNNAGKTKEASVLCGNPNYGERRELNLKALKWSRFLEKILIR